MRLFTVLYEGDCSDLRPKLRPRSQRSFTWAWPVTIDRILHPLPHGLNILRRGRQIGVAHESHEHSRVISLNGTGEIIPEIFGPKFYARVNLARPASEAADALVHLG